MQSANRILHVRHTAALYTDLLARGMYAPPDALWELVKNGMDAVYRLLNVRPQLTSRFVQIQLVQGHPLCPKDLALLVTDSGTGLTEVSLERYLTVGGDDDTTTGLMDQKRIGRIAAFALMKREHQAAGYWVLSSTSATGQVMMMNVSPQALAQQELQMRDIPRDDIHLGGRCPEGSFTTILIPHVMPQMRDLNRIRTALQWNVPRYTSEGGIQILVGDEEMVPPSLPRELVIHWQARTNTARVFSGREALEIESPLSLNPDPDDIIGFFAKTDEVERRGIRFNDATTRTRVAQALKMIVSVPFPFGKTELDGDLFMGGIIRQQDTARTGFSPEFLASDEWKGAVQAFIEHFVKPLARLIGDDVVLRDDPLGRVMRQLVEAFRNVFGAPDRATRIPDGIQPPPGFDGDEDGDQSPERSDEPVKHPKPHSRPKKKATPQLFKYKGVTYVLGTSREEPNVAAKFYGPNTVCLNTRDYMTQQGLKNASAALRLYVLFSVIRCIEGQLNELSPEAVETAAQESLLRFYDRPAE